MTIPKFEPGARENLGKNYTLTRDFLLITIFFSMIQILVISTKPFKCINHQTPVYR